MLADGVFGDGFAFDSMMQAAVVSDAADLSEGEAVRFFPGLRRRGDLPPELTNHVFRRAAQIEQRTAAAEVIEFEGKQNELERQFDARVARPAGWPAETSEDALWLRSLVNTKIARSEIRDLRLMARFAFLTGIHPAYLWPEVEVLPSWGATAAWLGEFSRRGRALMLPEVAEFLSDALTQTRGRTILRDPSLSHLLINELLASMLLRVSRRCLAGAAAEARWPSRGLTSVGSVYAATLRMFMLIASIFSERHSRRPP